MRRRSDTANAFATAIACYFIASCTASCYALVIDDFSLDQVGISAGQNAVYDAAHSPQLFSGTRVISGGTQTPCNNCLTATVTGGQLVINQSDVTGAGNVSWDGSPFSSPVDTTSMHVELSAYVGLEIDVAEVTGSVPIRFSLASDGANFSQFTVSVNSPGPHAVYFANFFSVGPPLNLYDVRNITISTGLDAGESIKYDSLSVVPEPSAFFLISTAVLGLMPGRQRP